MQKTSQSEYGTFDYEASPLEVWASYEGENRINRHLPGIVLAKIPESCLTSNVGEPSGDLLVNDKTPIRYAWYPSLDFVTAHQSGSQIDLPKYAADMFTDRATRKPSLEIALLHFNGRTVMIEASDNYLVTSFGPGFTIARFDQALQQSNEKEFDFNLTHSVTPVRLIAAKYQFHMGRSAENLIKMTELLTKYL